MNKMELIRELGNKCNLSKKEAAAVVNLFFDKITSALADGGRLEIRGLCTFFVKEYGSYNGRNPKTGEEIPISARRVVTFRPGQKLKARVEAYAGTGE